MRSHVSDNLKAALLALVLIPTSAVSHPHVFVDTGLKVIVGTDGRVEGVEVSWAYDALYSLLVFEELGLDQDYDGTLTDVEIASLSGFDLKWVAEYKGDLYLEAGGVAVELAAPVDRGVVIEDARIVSTHYRALTAPLSPNGLILRAYDPTFYTAYELTRGVSVDANCAVDVTSADLDAAYTLVEEMLYVMPARPGEDVFPEVGEAFADTVVIECTG